MLCFQIFHLVLGSNGNIYQVIEILKLGSRELFLQFFGEPIIETLLLLVFISHFFGRILRKSVEDIDIGNHITIPLGKIKKFLHLDVHDALEIWKKRKTVRNSSHVKR